MNNAIKKETAQKQKAENVPQAADKGKPDFRATYYSADENRIMLINKKSRRLPDGENIGIYAKNDLTHPVLIIGGMECIELGKPLPSGHVVKNGLDTLGIPTHKYFQYCCMKLKEQTHYKEEPTKDQRTIHIDIGEYLEVQRRANTKDGRKHAKTELNDIQAILFNSTVVYPVRKMGKRQLKGYVHFMSRFEETPTGFDITLDEEFAVRAIFSRVSYVPMDLMTAGGNAYYLGFKLAQYYYHDGNARRSGETDEDAKKHMISVRTLLDACPNIVTIEEARKKRHLKRDVFEPFERAMIDLFEEQNDDGTKVHPAFVSWEYRKPGAEHEPYSSEELKVFTAEMFVESYIYYTMEDVPNQEERIEKNRQRRKKKDAQIEKSKNERIGKVLADREQASG